MKIILIIFGCIVSYTSFAQQEIKIEDAIYHVGDSVKICSKVYGGKYLPDVKGQPTFLNFGGNYPNAPLTIAIWNDIRNEFEEAPEEFYKGVQVCIVGKIVLYKGKPEIILRNKNQILSAVKNEEVIKRK